MGTSTPSMEGSAPAPRHTSKKKKINVLLVILISKKYILQFDISLKNHCTDDVHDEKLFFTQVEVFFMD
jgi:hypothetical protein